MNFGILAGGSKRAATIAGLTALLCGLGGGAAHAFPKFSQKEKKPCSYCHVNAAGGGKRNAAGLWYQQHGLSFAGYSPEKAAQAAAGGKPKTSAATKIVVKTTKKAAPKKAVPKKPVKKA